MGIRQAWRSFKLPEEIRTEGEDAYTRDAGLRWLPVGMISSFVQWKYFGAGARFDAVDLLLLFAVNVAGAVTAGHFWGRTMWSLSERNHRDDAARTGTDAVRDSDVSSRWP
jgi:hypothetical protein